MATSTFSQLRKAIALSTVGLLTAITANESANAASLNPDSSLPVQLRIASVDDPDNHITTDFDGVAVLFGPPEWLCGATLLETGRHLLTAGHCWFNYQTNSFRSTSDFSLGFNNFDSIVSPTEFFLHPGFDPYRVDHDIAIIEIAEELPEEEFTRYGIYRDSNEIGKISDKVGYGGHGTGDTGVEQLLENFDNLKRTGQNVYDAPGELLNGLVPGFSILPGTQLAYDFDNGLPENDAFGQVFGPAYADLGLGTNEVNSVIGDSGGPTFIDGLIAGVTSYGLGADRSNELVSTDVTPLTDSSFGEISVDTRVSFYADWIDSVLEERTSVPEPSFLAGLIVLGAGVALKGKKGDRHSK